ncbi:L-threonylcarbamoyladenylate synthase [Chloroflexota bacterium]
MPKQLTLDIDNGIEQAISILKKGGIVAFPTDTVYGLGACAEIPRAVERIYEVKERPRSMALPLLLAEISQIGQVSSRVPEVAWVLADRFLPGALTLVLPSASSIPDIVTAGGKTVAVRIPAHPVPVALIKGLMTPVVGTSANLSSRPSPLTADEVSSQLGNRIDLIIDGGKCWGSSESTIVDVTGEKPVILRQGVISLAELRRVCPDIILREGN